MATKLIYLMISLAIHQQCYMVHQIYYRLLDVYVCPIDYEDKFFLHMLGQAMLFQFFLTVNPLKRIEILLSHIITITQILI